MVSQPLLVVTVAGTVLGNVGCLVVYLASDGSGY